jgi:DNA-binding transcriptional regulator LsrR (DeoR family)
LADVDVVDDADDTASSEKRIGKVAVTVLPKLLKGEIVVVVFIIRDNRVSIVK